MADATASTPRRISIDISPKAAAREARVWSVLAEQWFDFATMAFAPSPVKQKSAPLAPAADNPFLRSCPFVTLPPGEYKLYACPVGADDFEVVSDHVVPAAETLEGRAISITINQAR